MHLTDTMGTKVLVQKLNWIRFIGSSGKNVDGDGLFAQQVVVEKDDDYGYWIQTKGKDIWLRFSERNF
ncbi:MAG: hypothetical protein K2M91_04945 [Lachnospiraceae bacterium]|nr:hypothetical protein [Lachnospiraceae bacterium]